MSMGGRFGLLCLAYGSNANHLTALRYKPYYISTACLMLSNGLVAFTGAQTAIIHGYTDVNMGLGTAFLGITTCLIGRALLPLKPTFTRILLQALLGLSIYFFIIIFMVLLHVPHQSFKLITGLCFLIILFGKSYVKKRNTC